MNPGFVIFSDFLYNNLNLSFNFKFMINLAINGFGRIGRQAFKIAFDNKNIKIVGINDLTDTKTLAHLLQYDTAYGKYKYEVGYDEKNIIINP